MALVPFYKALADKFGRKPFLVLNTLGMGVGMALAWWSPNMVLYFIGHFTAKKLTGRGAW